MRNASYKSAIDFDGILEVKFPADIAAETATIDKFDSLPDLLIELDKQVSEVDGSVTNLVALKDEIDMERKALEASQRELEESRFAFEQQMKVENQKLNDLKIDFEQEKTKIFNEIQSARELLEKNKRTFEKYRQEQLALIERNKKTLTKNYEQFEKIVNKFNDKIENFEN